MPAMPQFGVCTSYDSAPAVKEMGWDFIEVTVGPNLEGMVPDSEWKGLERAKTCPLPIPAANSLLPATLKVTGPEADLAKLREYMTRVIQRAQKIGIERLVFGSGGARKIPDGFDRAKAKDQILAFLRMAAPIAQQHKVTLVCEHLNKGETNVINSVDEAMTYVKEVNHPGFQCLVDSWHFWLEEEKLSSLEKAMPYIKHVHVADKDGRVAPGESGTSDYRPFFKVLKKGGYDGRVSVEASKFDIPATAPRVLAFLKKQWSEA